MPDLAPTRAEDLADIPGEWFWEEAEEAAAEEARDNDASNALKLLLLEEAAHGAPHRSALRSHLAAVGMRPEDTVLRVTPEDWATRRPRGAASPSRPERNSSPPVGRGEATDADEAWNVVSALMADESPAAIEREVRARGSLAGCVRGCCGLPVLRQVSFVGGGWGGVRGARRTRWRRAGWEKMEAVGVPPRETRRRRWCWRRRRGRSAEPSRASSDCDATARRRRGLGHGRVVRTRSSFIRVCNHSLQKVRVGIGSSQSPFGIALRDPPQQNGTRSAPASHSI